MPPYFANPYFCKADWEYKKYRRKTRPTLIEEYRGKCAHCLNSTDGLYLQRIYQGYTGIYYAKQNMIPLCKSCFSRLLYHPKRIEIIANNIENFPFI